MLATPELSSWERFASHVSEELAVKMGFQDAGLKFFVADDGLNLARLITRLVVEHSWHASEYEVIVIFHALANTCAFESGEGAIENRTTIADQSFTAYEEAAAFLLAEVRNWLSLSSPQ